jgi:hypothetical protein
MKSRAAKAFQSALLSFLECTGKILKPMDAGFAVFTDGFPWRAVPMQTFNSSSPDLLTLWALPMPETVRAGFYPLQDGRISYSMARDFAAPFSIFAPRCHAGERGS